ncbi:MAG: hypothetical protein JRG91_21330, partial [Deltaproteobacteria bacterium]|nr:hypothetical protein [Deltaproteobacteria bacterium]
ITLPMLVILMIPPAVHAKSGGKWKKHGVKKGVTVYTQTVEGSGVPRIKAVSTVTATTDEVWDSFQSTLKTTKGLKQFKKLGSCGENCEFIYQRLGNALIKDRHYVVKMRWTINEKDGARTYRRMWNKTSEKSPEGKGALPVQAISGSWTFKPTDVPGQTRIVYVNHMDLGGSVPDGLFSMGFVSYGYKIVAKLRKAF